MKTKYYVVVNKYKIELDFMRQLTSNRTWIEVNCKDGRTGCEPVGYKINIVHILRYSYCINRDSVRLR